MGTQRFKGLYSGSIKGLYSGSIKALYGYRAWGLRGLRACGEREEEGASEAVVTRDATVGLQGSC